MPLPLWVGLAEELKDWWGDMPISLASEYSTPVLTVFSHSLTSNACQGRDPLLTTFSFLSCCSIFLVLLGLPDYLESHPRALSGVNEIVAP